MLWPPGPIRCTATSNPPGLGSALIVMISSTESIPSTSRLHAVSSGLQPTIAAASAYVMSPALVDSPACLVADEGDMNANLARMLKSMGQPVPESKPILEINPRHDFIVALAAVRWLLRYISGHDFSAFAIYRIIIGVVMLGILFTAS